MYLEVRQAVMKVMCPHIDPVRLNKILKVALEYDFCDVSVESEEDNTNFFLKFRKSRTSVFVEQFAMFWMRPFGFEYSIDFDVPENGRELPIKCEAPVLTI
jgi:hypothetical protein